MQPDLFRLDNTLPHDPAIDGWFASHPGELGSIARHWFELMRQCGDEVRECMHDGCPTACLGDAAFAYVNIFTAHVNVGFFHGASLPDPACLLEGSGKRMRHVKLRLVTPTNAAAGNNQAAMRALIDAAYRDIQARVEHG